MYRDEVRRGVHVDTSRSITGIRRRRVAPGYQGEREGVDACALRVLHACGMSTSDAIRSSVIESARRVRRSETLAREVAELEADEVDRAEMLEVAGLMESLRAAR